MKKTIFIFLMITLSLLLSGQTTDTAPKPMTLDEMNKEFFKFRNELDAVKKDIDILKERTEWFTFSISGYIKIIYGVNLWSHPGKGFVTDAPIAHGFDFENKIRFRMLLGNKIVATSVSNDDYQTEISIALKIKSLGISKMKPAGSWYVVAGKDDMGNNVDIYLPRNEAGGSNVVFGNYEIALDEAKVKNILGTGFFVNYKDVTEVHEYYGATGMAEVLKLNFEYFDNGYITDSKDKSKVASLYYSFDPEYYEPENHVSEAMSLWSNSMLKTDPTDPINSKYNQKPHGISFGYQKSLTDGFDLYLEIGAASKDAFDPKYLEDNSMDYGFFLRTAPKLYNDNLVFNPKLSLSYALQTGTTEDLPWPWSTFAGGLSLPLSVLFSKTDFLKMEFNYNINVHIVNQQFAHIFSLNTELNLFENKFQFSLPAIYSFKNGGGSGTGFQRVGYADVKVLDQLYDDHILNLGFLTTFDSTNMFGDIFEYKLINKIYFTLMLQHDLGNYIYWYYLQKQDIPFPGVERYFFEILRNEFILHNLSVEKVTIFLEFGLGYLNNAKIVDSTTIYKYLYDYKTDTYSDNPNYTGDIMQWKIWPEAVVLSIKTGFDLDIIKNFSIGFAAESPKIYINSYIINHFYALDNDQWLGNQYNILGNQQSYGLFKLYSAIKF